MGAKIKPPSYPSNIFFPTIINASEAAPGIHQIKGQFDKVTKIHPSSWAHTTRSAKDDEMLMLKDLCKLHSSVTDAMNTFKRLLYLHWLHKTWKSFFLA